MKLFTQIQISFYSGRRRPREVLATSGRHLRAIGQIRHGAGVAQTCVAVQQGWCQSDPLENCHLNVKKLPKMTIYGNFLKQMSSFLGQFFDIQMTIFQRVRFLPILPIYTEEFYLGNDDEVL